jgi:purine-nucleoside phosphorylase
LQKRLKLQKELNIEVQEGIYLGLQGPFETLAEYKMVKTLGADCVECQMFQKYCSASHGLRNFGISVITDMGDAESIGTISNMKPLKLLKRRTKTHKDTDNFLSR